MKIFKISIEILTKWQIDKKRPQAQMQPELFFTVVHTLSDKTLIKCRYICDPLPVPSKKSQPT